MHSGSISLWQHFHSLSFILFLMVICSDQILTGRGSGTVIPPPLVRGGQQVSSKHGSQIIMPPLVRGAQVSHGEMLTILLAKIIKITFLSWLCLILAWVPPSYCCVTLYKTNYREIITLKLRTYDLSLRLSLCVCPLLWCFGCPFLVLHYLCP